MTDDDSCNSITQNLAIPEPSCLGKTDAIMASEIEDDPYCLNNKCYEKSTLMQLENGKDPFTRAKFNMSADDDYQPPNPEAIEGLQSRQWGYAPTVQSVLELAEKELDFPIPRANEPYQGSLLQLRDNAFRSWIWQLLDATKSFFALDASLSEANITEEQKQMFFELGYDIIHNNVVISVHKAFNLPEFPDPDQLVEQAAAEDRILDALNRNDTQALTDTLNEIGWTDPDLDIGAAVGADLDVTDDGTYRHPLDFSDEEEEAKEEAWDPSVPSTVPSMADLDAADEREAEEKAQEISENLNPNFDQQFDAFDAAQLADLNLVESKDENEDPLAQFDSFFESDSDDDSPRRRRRNQSFQRLRRED